MVGLQQQFSCAVPPMGGTPFDLPGSSQNSVLQNYGLKGVSLSFYGETWPSMTYLRTSLESVASWQYQTCLPK